ncbi:MAG: MlaC/ttg2D family ABC transporter substrate-binding protein [Gammaproteobacteria bacterium]
MKGFLLAMSLLFAVPCAAAVTPEEAKALVQSTADNVTERVRTEREVLRADRSRLYGLVNELVVPHFDFERIARWVLGKHWPTANAQQRQRFTDEFKKLMVRTYATVLLEYVDQEIRYLPLNADPNAERITVRTEITAPGGGAPLPVNYRLHARDNGWKVYDISVDGISLLSTYRSSFAADIQRLGLDGLITQLAHKDTLGVQVQKK